MKKSLICLSFICIFSVAIILPACNINQNRSLMEFPVAYDGDNNPIYSGVQYELPERLILASSAVADRTESSISLKVDIKPANATYNKCEWSLRWNNPTSDWAKDKNVENYVSVLVASSTLEAVLNCSQAFGEQIILIVNLPYEGNVLSTQCRIDYRERAGKFFANANGQKLLVSDGQSTVIDMGRGVTTGYSFTYNDANTKNIGDDIYTVKSDRISYTASISLIPMVGEILKKKFPNHAINKDYLYAVSNSVITFDSNFLANFIDESLISNLQFINTINDILSCTTQDMLLDKYQGLFTQEENLTLLLHWAAWGLTGPALFQLNVMQTVGSGLNETYYSMSFGLNLLSASSFAVMPQELNTNVVNPIF